MIKPNASGADPASCLRCCVCSSRVALQLNLDALKSATLLSWLKDAGFYAMKNVSFDVSATLFETPDNPLVDTILCSGVKWPCIAQLGWHVYQDMHT